MSTVTLGPRYLSCWHWPHRQVGYLDSVSSTSRSKRPDPLALWFFALPGDQVIPTFELGLTFHVGGWQWPRCIVQLTAPPASRDARLPACAQAACMNTSAAVCNRPPAPVCIARAVAGAPSFVGNRNRRSVRTLLNRAGQEARTGRRGWIPVRLGYVPGT